MGAHGNVGHQRIKSTDNASCTDWKVGIAKNLAIGFAVALGYDDTNADKLACTNPHGDFLGRSTNARSVTNTF